MYVLYCTVHIYVFCFFPLLSLSCLAQCGLSCVRDAALEWDAMGHPLWGVTVGMGEMQEVSTRMMWNWTEVK